MIFLQLILVGYSIGQTPCPTPQPPSTGTACVTTCGNLDPFVMCSCLDDNLLCACSSGFIQGYDGKCLALKTCENGFPNSCALIDEAATCVPNDYGGFSCICSSNNYVSQNISAATQLCVSIDDVRSCFPYGGETSVCQAAGDIGATCQEVSNSCTEPSMCVATSFQCHCSAGFSISNKICRDVDECKLGTSQCSSLGDASALCKNNIGAYNCDCSDGFKELLENGEARCYPERDLKPSGSKSKWEVLKNAMVFISVAVFNVLMSPFLLIGTILTLPIRLLNFLLQEQICQSLYFLANQKLVSPSEQIQETFEL
ncbi:fibrillin-2-like isoform X3 [Artemia franciscana]|uniref:fibrillin-2-like isoform X3 n=1 Tax=Artemia franciscana TaxID=6661 RepID=UPI0032D9D61B